jgi:hypothetical protein
VRPRIENQRHPRLRIPERRSVTVCIAAACEIGTHNRKLILCADMLQSGAMGKADTSLKIRLMGHHGWQLLTAGDDDEIQAMLPLFRRCIRERSTAEGLTETDATAAVRAAISIRRAERAEEIVRGKYAISYDELKRAGRDFIPDEDYRQTLRDISAPLRATFILAGLPSGFPFIIETQTNGTTCVREDFAVIGAGEYLAQSALLQRGYSDVYGLDRALYMIYEAKRYAEGEISVGSATTMRIVERGEFRSIKASGLKWLSQQFDTFGPKNIANNLKIPEDAFGESSQVSLPASAPPTALPAPDQQPATGT